MRRVFIVLLMMILMVLLASPGQADEIMTVTVAFDPAELSWDIQDGYDRPRLADCDLTGEVGAPQLPARSVQVALPANRSVARVEVIATQSHLLPGRKWISPAQPPQILSLDAGKSQAIDFVLPDPAVYRGERPYPERVAEYTGCGQMGPVHLANLVVYPLQYLPQSQQIRFHERVELALHLREGRSRPLLRRSRTAGHRDPLLRAVQRLVLNGRDVGRFYPRTGDGEDLDGAADLAEYVIITDLAFQEAFQTLADWKIRKGLTARVVTLQEIDSQYSGDDRGERIRACITKAYQDWGAVYVLLAGDTQLIPVRYAYAMDSQTEYNDIPCDLYYADLDGNWNADGDDVYGEVEDGVDLFPEVFLGRAPVSTVAQAENFVRKVLTYERPEMLDYQEKALFAAEVLWYDPFTDASKSKDLIDERYLPGRFDPVTKLYETLGNEDPYSVMNALDQGQNIFNHDGHAYYSVMGMGSGYLDNSQVDHLNNGDRIGLVYSIGCWPAAFDYDCIAEHFVNNDAGGSVAFIGNSRYGWGSPGNPCFGYSDRFDQYFFKTLFEDGLTRLGEALSTAKAHYAPRSQQENVYRWHQYQVTLLGDPEMPLWTRTPRAMTVRYPDHLPAADSSQVMIAVDGPDGQPVAGALVCLMDEAAIYLRSETDVYGTATFSLPPAAAETLWVTVTAAEFIPYQGHLVAISSGPHLSLGTVQIEEIVGNGDGLVSPLEQIGFDFQVKNCGDETAAAVTANLAAREDAVDTTIFLGDIEPGETISPGLAGRFTIAQECPNDHVLQFDILFQDEADHSWDGLIGVQVATPVISYQSCWLDDAGRGNGNGVPDPGEELDLHVTVANIGGQRATSLSLQLDSEDPYLELIEGSADLGSVDPQSTAEAVFRIRVADRCPEPQFAALEITGLTGEGYPLQQRLLLTVGRVGFSDDLESGSIYWSHYSTDSRWHFTDRRTHSGRYAWYCGDEETGAYDPGMDCSLTAFPMVVGPGARLSFWHWYDLATYGSDGLYVEINDGTGWETLDFLGSGGALGGLLIGNDWFQDSYDLSSVPPGTFLQVRFRFHSDVDDSVGEGAYVDDISLACDVVSHSEQDPVPCRPTAFALFQNYPNPFNAATQLRLDIPVLNTGNWGHLPVDVTAEVYNINGQKVRTLVHGKLGAGKHLLRWDGTDGQGRPVGSGIYFCRVRAGSYRRDVKMVLLR
jgi:hypothetical protein